MGEFIGFFFLVIWLILGVIGISREELVEFGIGLLSSKGDNSSFSNMLLSGLFFKEEEGRGGYVVTGSRFWFFL